MFCNFYPTMKELNKTCWTSLCLILVMIIVASSEHSYSAFFFFPHTVLSKALIYLIKTHTDPLEMNN